jgi:hypothetical protein
MNRQKFDYVDFTAPDASMASEYIETTAKVVSQIRRYLNKDK